MYLNGVRKKQPHAFHKLAFFKFVYTSENFPGITYQFFAFSITPNILLKNEKYAH